MPSIHFPNIILPNRNLLRPEWPVGINWDSPQADGLVAWYPLYPFEDAWDFGPRGKHRMTNTTGIPWTSESDFGMGMVPDLDGSNDFRGTDPPVTALPMTLTAWVRRDVVAAQTVISISRGGTDNSHCRIVIDAVNKVRANYIDFNAGQVNAIHGTATGTGWHLVVGVFAGISSRTVFLDDLGGVEDTGGTTDITGIDTITLGVLRFPTDTQRLNGRIKDAKVYNRALSSTDVEHLFNLRTRWDLYHPLGRVSYFVPPPAAPPAGADVGRLLLMGVGR